MRPSLRGPGHVVDGAAVERGRGQRSDRARLRRTHQPSMPTSATGGRDVVRPFPQVGSRVRGNRPDHLSGNTYCVTDPLGRTGEGFTFAVKASTETLILDPDTGHLVATNGGPHGPRTSAPRRCRRIPRPRRPRGQTPGIVITSLPTVCWFAKSVSATAASDSAYARLIAAVSFPSSIMEASMPR